MTEIKKEKPMIRIRGARENNLKNIDLDLQEMNLWYLRD